MSRSPLHDNTMRSAAVGSSASDNPASEGIASYATPPTGRDGKQKARVNMRHVVSSIDRAENSAAQKPPTTRDRD